MSVCGWMAGWLDGGNAVYTHSGMLFRLKKERVSPATTWISLGDIVLSDKYCVIPLM